MKLGVMKRNATSGTPLDKSTRRTGDELRRRSGGRRRDRQIPERRDCLTSYPQISPFSWHTIGTLAASKRHQTARPRTIKSLCLQVVGCACWCDGWTFNPLGIARDATPGSGRQLRRIATVRSTLCRTGCRHRLWRKPNKRTLTQKFLRIDVVVVHCSTPEKRRRTKAIKESTGSAASCMTPR